MKSKRKQSTREPRRHTKPTCWVDFNFQLGKVAGALAQNMQPVDIGGRQEKKKGRQSCRDRSSNLSIFVSWLREIMEIDRLGEIDTVPMHTF